LFQLEIFQSQLLDWCRASGLPSAQDSRVTLDRPDFKTGSPNIDDGWIKDTIRSLLPMLKRNVIVMEVRFFLIFCPFATAVGFR
jgi:hypothetical protein